MVRRRFMSKGNATFVDGLDKSALKQVSNMNGVILTVHLVEEWNAINKLHN